MRAPGAKERPDSAYMLSGRGTHDVPSEVPVLRATQDRYAHANIGASLTARSMLAGVDAAASAKERTRPPPSAKHDPEGAAMERCVKRGLNAVRVRRAIELA